MPQDSKPARNAAKVTLESLIAAASADAAELVPDRPIEVALLDDGRLAKGALKLRAKLAKLPSFEVALVDALPGLLGEVKLAEKNWLAARTAKKGASTKKSHDEAVQLRRSLVAAGHFLFRKDPTNLAEIDRLAHGDTVADLVSHLGDLGELAEQHRADFEAVPTVPKNAIARAKELAEILGTGVDGEGAEAARKRRNLVYAAVHGAVEEVRSAVRLLLHDDPKQLAPLLSHYNADKLRRARNKKGEGAPSENPTPAPKA